MQKAITEYQHSLIVRFLEDNLAEAHNDPKDFAYILTQAAAEDQRFRTVLKEWLNRKTFFSDIIVNGYSLHDIASVYCDRRLGVLIALRLLWDEAAGMNNICLCAGQSCIAEASVLSGKPVKTAILEKNGWYLYAGDLLQQDPEELNMGGYSLYQVCEVDPNLIELLTAEDIPAGSYAERTGESSFNLWINADQ